MKIKSEGIRRLGVFLGAIGFIAWIVFVLCVSEGFTDMGDFGWYILFVGAPVSFFVPWGLVKSIHWVYLGFKSDKN